MPADRRQVLRLAAPVLWTILLLLPAEAWAPLDGVALGSTGTAVLGLVWWVWYAREGLPGGVWLPAGLLAIKAIVAVATVPHGFTATYFANGSWTPPRERSIEWRAEPFTRRDLRLAFTSPDGPELPLHFFHDNARFNVATRAGREGLPFSVAWEGYWRVDEPATLPLYLAGHGLHATLAVDGRLVVEKPDDAIEAFGEAVLEAGWRHVSVLVAAPAGQARSFEAGTVSADGTRRALGSPDVYPSAPGRSARAWDARARTLGRAAAAGTVIFIGGLALATLAGVLRALRYARALRADDRLPAWLAIASLAALADAWWFAKGVEDRLLLLLGGDDMLTYATLARDIALNGPLMLAGQPPGQAEPFYYQPLYPYVLALTHLVWGDDGFGIFLVQRLGVWITWLAAWRTAHLLLGLRAGGATLVIAGVFVMLRVRPWSGVLLAEAIFIPLLAVCAWSLVIVAQRESRRATVAAGIAGGLATLARSTLVPAWFLVLPLLVAARRHAGRQARPAVVVALLVAGITGLATARNWVAAGQFVPVASSFANNFYLGNPPPDDMPVSGPGEHALLRRLPIADPTRLALEGALHAPGRFAGNLGRKALYALGVFGAYPPGSGWSALLIVTWVLALGGFVVIARHGQGRDPAVWLPAVFAGTHLVAVTVIFPHAHGDRLILPMYVMLLPYAGAAAGAVLDRFLPHEDRTGSPA
jgi:hypothetical protein